MVRVINWSGYDWTVRETQPSHGPGPNAWSDSTNAASVDGSGVLTLKIDYEASAWRCVELNGPHLGYGRYVWVVETDPQGWTIQPVLGLFTYDESDDGSNNYREIDIEFSKWNFEPEPSRCWYSVQPVVDTETHEEKISDHQLGPDTPYTCEFVWEPGAVYFRTTDRYGNILGEHRVTEGVPVPGAETVRMNLWLIGGTAPSDGQPIPVQISSFDFTAGFTHEHWPAKEIEQNFARNRSRIAVKQGTGGSTLSEFVGDELVIHCTKPDYSVAYTGSVYDLEGSHVSIRVEELPALADYTTEAIWCVRFDDQDWIGMFWAGGTLYARRTQAGVNTNVSLGEYNPTLMRYWRIRESSGVIYYEYAADVGGPWITATTLSHALGSKLHMMRLRWECGFYGTASDPGAFKVAAINPQVAPSANNPIRSFPHSDATQVVRLEIEKDPDGLKSLVPNASGELGAWGWVTSVSGQRLAAQNWSDGVALWFTTARTTDSAGNYFQTIPMTVTPGKWVAASWDTLVSDTGLYRARMVFRDSSGATVSSTSWTNFTGTGRANLNGVTVPAGAVEVLLKLEIGEGGSFPWGWGGWRLVFRNVTVAQADTAGELGTSRTNLFTDNPSFESSSISHWSGWPLGASQLNASGSRINGVAAAGSWSLEIKAEKSNVVRLQWSNVLDPVPVIGGQDYTISLASAVGADYTAREVGVTVFYNDGSSRQDLGVIGTEVWGEFTRLYKTFTVPVGMSQIDFIVFRWLDCVKGELHYLDAIMIEKGATQGPFITGTQVDASNLTYIPPVEYENVMGDALSVTVTREELNVGTLTGEILSTTLDPSVSSLIRPGRRVRLLVDADGLWEPLLLGKVEDAKVSYDPLNPVQEWRTRISLTVVDAISALARTKQPNSVARVSKLPYLLESAGVPWDCDGISDQVATATVVARNDNASALDQVALTRDSASGYAWVNRHGVLMVRSSLPSVGVELFPEGDMTNLADWSAEPGVAVALTSVGNGYGGTGQGLRLTVDNASNPSGGSNYLAAWARMPVPSPSTGIEVVPGFTYQIRWATKAGSTARRTLVAPLFVDSDGNGVGDFLGDLTDVHLNSTTWQVFTREVVAPPGAVAMAVVVTALSDDYESATPTNLPDGEQHFFDYISVVATSNALTLDDTVYNPNIAIDFDMTRCINSVSVKRQFLDKKGQGQEESYGPYEDASSIAQWGLHSAEFTVVGLQGSDMASYAGGILAKNAQPVRQANTVVVPIDYTSGSQWLTVDLYDLVRIVNAEAGIDSLRRITRLIHTITPSGHLLELGFTDEKAVAAPTAQPPLPGIKLTGITRMFAVKNGDMSIGDASFTTVTGWTKQDSANVNGPTAGVVTVQEAGTYVVAAALSFEGNTAGRRIIRLNQNGSEVARNELTSSVVGNQRVTPSITFPITLEAGDTLSLDAYQGSGGNLNVLGGFSYWRFYRLGD